MFVPKNMGAALHGCILTPFLFPATKYRKKCWYVGIVWRRATAGVTNFGRTCGPGLRHYSVCDGGPMFHGRYLHSGDSWDSVTSAVETSRREISEDASSFGIGTLLVVDQSSLGNCPTGVHMHPYTLAISLEYGSTGRAG